MKHDRQIEPERKRGRKRCALSVVCKFTLGKRAQQGVGIERESAFARACKRTDKINQFGNGELDFHAAVFYERRAVCKPHLHAADLRADIHGFEGHFADVDVNLPCGRVTVDTKIQIERNGLREHARKRRSQAVERGNFLFVIVGLGERRAEMRFEVIRKRRRFGFVRTVFKIGAVCGSTGRTHAHDRRILFVDFRAQNLPVVIERVRHRNIVKRRQRRQIARKNHLIDVMTGRLIDCGIEIVGLRIGSVAVVDHLVGIQQGFFVDNVNRKSRAGKSVFPGERFKRHVPVGRAVLPLHGGKFRKAILALFARRPGRRAAAAHAPDNFVAAIAKLARLIYHTARRDIRHDQRFVIVLLIGVDRLVDVDAHGVGKRRTVHLGIPLRLRRKPFVHVTDIFERAVINRARTVGRKFVRYRHETGIDFVRIGFVENRTDRHDPHA